MAVEEFGIVECTTHDDGFVTCKLIGNNRFYVSGAFVSLAGVIPESGSVFEYGGLKIKLLELSDKYYRDTWIAEVVDDCES